MSRSSLWYQRAAAPGRQACGDPPVIVHLLPAGTSGVTGTARLSLPGDDRLRVALTASGLTPGGTYTGAIHFGACASQGPAVFALADLVAGADGTATATTVVAGIQVIPPQGWDIEVGTTAGTALACGDVAPGRPVLAPGATVLHEPVTVTLSPQDGSAANGSALLHLLGPRTLVATLRLNSLKPGSVHPAHIHFGSCAAGGPIALPLADLVAAPDGTALQTTVVPDVRVIPPIGWYVNVHQGPTLAGGGATPIACGDVVTGGPVLP